MSLAISVSLNPLASASVPPSWRWLRRRDIRAIRPWTIFAPTLWLLYALAASIAQAQGLNQELGYAPQPEIGANAIPELGEPADQVLAPSEERALGAQFYADLRQRNALVEDAQIVDYIQALGHRLVNRNALGTQDFTFFVIDSPGLNAFAVPGGYIGLYSGLIRAARNEAQLASVLSHEIAHIHSAT